jgi:hypothetical protein
MAPTSFPHPPNSASATAAFLHGVQKLKYSSVLIFQTIRVGRSEFCTLFLSAWTVDELAGFRFYFKVDE